MAKPKLNPDLLKEFWEIDRFDMCLGGLNYNGQLVYSICAKSRQEVKDGIADYRKRMCK